MDAGERLDSGPCTTGTVPTEPTLERSVLELSEEAFLILQAMGQAAKM